MTGKAFNELRATGPVYLHWVLSLALLFATALDVGHQHDSPISELQCYSCHFSPDLGLTTVAAEPAAVVVLSLPRAAALPEALLPARTTSYSARGPPLPV
jgi:cytochrome b561